MEHNFNIDIHCHSSLKAFMSGRHNHAHTPFESFTNEIKAWWLKRLGKQIEKKAHLKFATQSNFDNLYKGNVSVVIVSLTPIEKAIFAVDLKATGLLKYILKKLVANSKTPGGSTLKTDIINALTGFNHANIEFTHLQLENYFREGLVAEYDYLTKFNNQQSATENYRIRFVKNFAEIESNLVAATKTICVILSIEGAHTLSGKAPHINQIHNNQGKSHQQDLPDFSSLQDYAKNIAEMKKWDFAPFYITLNHLFWNGLAGHAKSLGNPFGKIVSQAEGINEGLKEMGKEVIKLLLDTRNGPRILLDIKHMSPQCRKNFYAFIKTDYWSRNDKFPLICSHTGVVSKKRTLDSLAKQDDEAELNNRGNFLDESSINICEEDILLIAETGGLIGLQLDESRMAGNQIISIIKKNKKKDSSQLRKQYIKVMFANIFEIINTVKTKDAWNLLSIGSDFDGFIRHFDCYPTTAELPVLRNDMLAFLKNPEEISQEGFNYRLPLPAIKNLMFDLSPETIIEKIFAGNVMAFLRKHFNR
jgi:microsomal dipeptidase-like Zn-dependent dipeptidase